MQLKNVSMSQLILTTMMCFVLFGCASSNVTRDVSSGVDQGRQNTRTMVNNATEGDMATTWQNTSQATKGAIMGGAVGAATGLASSSVGFIPGTLVGMILGASYGSYIDANATIEDQLENRGVNVIILGDQIIIVIPSARIFDEFTPNINPSAYSTLELLAKYINSFDKTLVKIAVYTNNLGSCRANLALSREQADKLARFLTVSGMDARLLYAEGYGGTHLVQKNDKVWDGSDNYRIEITLEKLHA